MALQLHPFVYFFSSKLRESVVLKGGEMTAPQDVSLMCSYITNVLFTARFLTCQSLQGLSSYSLLER